MFYIYKYNYYLYKEDIYIYTTIRTQAVCAKFLNVER